MVKIAKRFTFDAAHCLPRLPAGHKCSRLHGHTYQVEIVLQGEPDDRGFVADYDDIAKAWAPINAVLDHSYLNEITGLETPSTEILVGWIFDKLLAAPFASLLYAIRVAESSTTWAEMTAREFAATRRAP